MFLPDVNFWLALAFNRHVHHRSANAWFATVPDGGASFCRVTQLGFLRLANNPKAVGGDAVTRSGAWQLYDNLQRDGRIEFAFEPVDVELHWRRHADGNSFSPNSWTDAYLAAFAEAGSFDLVTFDRGFSRFAGVTCTILS